jgi:hypothetical protein
MAETTKGQQEQALRIASGSPTPLTAVEGDYIDEQWEIDNVKDWTDVYIQNASDKAERLFFPPAQKRKLKPL